MDDLISLHLDTKINAVLQYKWNWLTTERRQRVQYVLVEGSGGYPKRNGAVSNAMTAAARYPTHQAPTQRGSFWRRVILQRKCVMHSIV